MIRRGTVAAAIVVAAWLAPAVARAGEPTTVDTVEEAASLDDAGFEDSDDEQAPARDIMAMPPLHTPTLTAYPPLYAGFALPPIQAARGKAKPFDTSHGEVDPRVKKVPRTHRFRLALHAHWVRLTRTQNPTTGEFERFHYAPMHIDLAYQAQFLKWVMVRVAVGIGANVANSRNSMPVSVFPQAFAGYQGKTAGVAFGYGFDWTIPPIDGASSPSSSFSLEQPVIRRNHVVMGEVSVTSRIDRVALTFALNIGGMKSRLTHFAEANNRFRLYLGLSAGAFFDGTIRREKKARKAAEKRGQ
ncbi:MAG: hypothetical protein KC457_10425 [Myxococcales bacterium]|nr:hypothetical protein [Myxococcales bacterium]